jgi:hypothetical protein
MEANVAEKLKQYGALRSTLIDSIFKQIPRSGFELNVVFHTVNVVCTIIVIISIFATARKLTLFTLHPVCMTVGTLLFLAEGIVSYRNSSLLDFLSPIMQHNKKVKVRAIHHSLQTAGAVFISLGMLFIISHKMENEKTILPSSPHSILGTVALLLIVVQVVTGHEKLAQLENGNRRVRRWHGDLGLLVWDTLSVTILLGLLCYLPLSLGTVFVLLCVLAVWLTLHVQMLSRPSLHKYDSAYAMDDSSSDLTSAVANTGTSSNTTHHDGVARNDSFGNLDLETAGFAEDSELIKESNNVPNSAFDKAFVRD